MCVVGSCRVACPRESRDVKSRRLIDEQVDAEVGSAKRRADVSPSNDVAAARHAPSITPSKTPFSFGNPPLFQFDLSNTAAPLDFLQAVDFWMWFLRDGMKIPAIRRYATIASGKSSLRGKKGPPLTLEHVGTLLCCIPRPGLECLI